MEYIGVKDATRLDGINGENGNDGLDIIWKGDASLPPANPQKNWVYRDTERKR